MINDIRLSRSVFNWPIRIRLVNFVVFFLFKTYDKRTFLILKNSAVKPRLKSRDLKWINGKRPGDASDKVTMSFNFSII